VANLGFRVEFEAPAGGPDGLGVVALQDDAGFTVFLEQTSRTIVGGQGSYAIQLEDVEAAHQRLSGTGLDFAGPPSKHFWGYGLVLRDPDGHVLHLWDERTMAEKG
jgi:uncharacterized glyoxalase superfamily protein PhnB